MPLEDAQRAMRLLRARAASLEIDPRKVGVAGFSAGGHLVTAIANARSRSYAPIDAADRLSAKHDFAIVLYPGHLWSGSGMNLYAFDPIDREGPPAFIVQAEDVDDVRNAIAYARALRREHVPVELHVYPRGGHAFGLRPTAEPITHWPELAQRWLHAIGMI